MKSNIALLLLCLAGHTLPCPAQNNAVRPDDPAEAQTPEEPLPLLLGDRNGRVQLTLPTGANPMPAAGGIKLRAFGETLLGGAGHNPSAAKTTSPDLGTLWLDGRAVRGQTTSSLKVLDRRSSNDWDFATLDLAPVFSTEVNHFRRHLLFVQPDLVVICDEVSPREPAAVQTGWWFPDGIAFDSVRNEWRLQLPRAGLTVRAFGSPGDFKLLDSANLVDPGFATDLKCLRAGVTNRIPEYRQITVLVPHEKEAKRSLAFKLLESDTAIGVRVHRDGLPTLIAFRKMTTSREADLTGLKFTGPVAVDVFQPRRK